MKTIPYTFSFLLIVMLLTKLVFNAKQELVSVPVLHCIFFFVMVEISSNQSDLNSSP